MRLIFMGTPPFAATALRALYDAGHEIAAVYTQPPRAARRGKKLQVSAVHELAEELAIAVEHPETLRDENAQVHFASYGAEAAIIAAYGLILPQAILDAPIHGCLNIHASLLPRWRGAAPIQHAILAGDRVTGVTTMQMEAGLDTGPMLLTKQVEIAGKTAGELTAELATVGGVLIVETLSALTDITPSAQPNEGVTYAGKIEKADAAIDFTRSAVEGERTVRAYNPWPGAWFVAAGERLKLLAATVVEDANATAGSVLDDGRIIACGDGGLRLDLVQRPGRRPMPIDELLNGFDMPTEIEPCPVTS
ncbi:MAG: methionyl-tRNA formyltransferase [Erythrobacter sp.]